MRVRPFALTLARPLSTARGPVARREGFLVGVEGESDRTVRGVGEATPLPGWTESRGECRDALGEYRDTLGECRNTLGEYRDDTVDVSATESDAPGHSTPAARHGRRLASLDATARSRDVALAELLAERAGGAADTSESVPVNATVGDADAEATADAAREAVESGFECLKLKVGARPLEADLDRVRAVVDAVDAAVRLDANGAWDRVTARRAVDAAADLGVAYVEQPLPAGDLSGLASLRGRGVDVAVDESLIGRDPVEVLEAGAADVAILKPMALGGPDVAVDVARRLRSHGVDPVITTTIDGAVARTAAVHVAASIPGVRPCGLATASLLAEDLGPDPAPVEDGRIRVPDGPGTCGDAFDPLVW